MNDILNSQIPQHVAIIMDGNGRWAKKIGKKELLVMKMEQTQLRNVLMHQ